MRYEKTYYDPNEGRMRGSLSPFRMLLFYIYGVLSFSWQILTALRLVQWTFGFEWVDPNVLGYWQHWTGWPALSYAYFFNRDMNWIYRHR